MLKKIRVDTDSMLKKNLSALERRLACDQLSALSSVERVQTVPQQPAPISITLTADEAAILTAPTGTGGQQAFHQSILNQLQGGNLIVRFNDEQLGKLIRYMTQYGPGGFQGRLQKAFRRPLLELLAA